jgi:uncharacterized repeat protein (TIGR03803 family)
LGLTGNEFFTAGHSPIFLRNWLASAAKLWQKKPNHMKLARFAMLFGAATTCFIAPVAKGQLSVSNFFAMSTTGPGAPYVLAGTNLYCLSGAGGAHDYGGIFSVSTLGHLNWDYSFGGVTEPNSLMQDSAGLLCGTGEADTVFFFTTNGVGGPQSLSYGRPTSGLLQGRDGNLYGAAGLLAGMIFCLPTTGSPWSLSVPNVGELGQLIQGQDGNLYDVASIGGSNNAGAVVCVGTNKSVHWVFSFNSTNGSDPTTLIQGADGNLYGTTADGGAQNFGTVFSISTNGQLVWSYSFPTSQQAYPLQQLVQGSDGRLYGATGRVGAFQIPSSAGGSVFSITTNGAPAWSYVFATRPGFDFVFNDHKRNLERQFCIRQYRRRRTGANPVSRKRRDAIRRLFLCPLPNATFAFHSPAAGQFDKLPGNKRIVHWHGHRSGAANLSVAKKWHRFNRRRHGVRLTYLRFATHQPVVVGRGQLYRHCQQFGRRCHQCSRGPHGH